MLIVCPAILIAVFSEKTAKQTITKKLPGVVNIAGMTANRGQHAGMSRCVSLAAWGGQYRRNDRLLLLEVVSIAEMTSES